MPVGGILHVVLSCADVVRRSCACSGAVNPRGQADLRSDGGLAGTTAINDGAQYLSRVGQDRQDSGERMDANGEPRGKGGSECREKWTGCAMRTKVVEARKV